MAAEKLRGANPEGRAPDKDASLAPARGLVPLAHDSIYFHATSSVRWRALGGQGLCLFLFFIPVPNVGGSTGDDPLCVRWGAL